MFRAMPMVFLGALAGVVAGCVTTETVHRPPPEPIPTGAVHQVHAAWEGRLMVTQDVVNNGVPLIGLAGRMYLFGPQVGYPVQGDGMAIIDLHDATQANAQTKPQLLERWEIDAVTLKRLMKKDTIGWGYTLFLPWKTYRPEITKVQLQIRYVPEKGGLPLFSPPSMITLNNDTQINVTQRQVPAGTTPAAPAAAPPAGSFVPPPPTPAPRP